MDRLWAKLLGAEQLEGGDVERWTVHWTRLDTPFQAFLFLLAGAAACYAVWWCYRREPAYCPRRRKQLLALLRALGLLLLLVILAGPVLEIIKSSSIRGKVVVLVDVSKSMSRTDAYVQPEDMLTAARALNLVPLTQTDARAISKRDAATLAKATRLDVVRAVLAHPRLRLLDRLRREHDVEVWSFARAADMLNLTAERPADEAVLDKVSADGAATELGAVLRATAERTRGQPLAGVILITDGGNNRGEDPEAAAAEVPAPIFPIGIGVPETKDLTVGHFFVESKLFVDDPAPVYVRLAQHGYDGESCSISVRLGDEELARQPVVLKPGGEQTEVVRVRPTHPGRFTLKIVVPPLAGEGEADNNAKEREVEVLDKKIRTLLIEDSPRWEFRFLFNALQRDKRVELKTLLRVPDLPLLAALPGSGFIKEFPKKEELLKFDAVILGNLANDAAWTEEDLDNLRRFVVQEGGGLWLIAGRNHMPDTYKGSKLELLIPVEFERMPELDAEDERDNPLAQGFRVMLTPEGKTHRLMRLDAGAGTEAENAGLWELLPDFYWFHKATRPKLGATVLLAHGGARGGKPAAAREGPPPLLVVSQVGRGRVLYSAVEELWRMRLPIELGPDGLDRFHGQALQYLGLPHCLGGSSRIEITTDREEYAVGDHVQFAARVLNKNTYEPSTAEKLLALAQDLENEARSASIELTRVPGQPGLFRGETIAGEQGRFRLTLKDEEEEGAYKDFTVRVPQLEMDSPEMKRDWLERIARAGRPPGSRAPARLYLPDQAGAIADELRAGQRRLEYRLEDPLWDAPLMLILFVGLLGAEWLIRKRSDLC